MSSFKKFCKKLLPFFLFFFTSILSNGQKTSANVISYPQDFPKEVATDIEALLQRSTGQYWDAVQQGTPSNTGVVLFVNTSGSYKTGESCRINSDGSTYIKFESSTTNGLIYGVYKYLRDLGFKFYLPDSLYTIIPTLKSVFKKTSVMETPFLRIRDFFGTGGFGSGKTDPDHSVQKAWQLWKWRNGFGTEFPLNGHVGEAFTQQNVKDLQKNPGWTASPVIKNGKTDLSTKINYYNDSAVDFFTNWVIKKYTAKNYKVPPASLTDMTSIEPSDGGGYITTPPKGSNLQTISDQVFYSANVAAKKLDRLFPDRPNIGINLYAYSTHADIPNFALNPRIFVQLIPYQYQNIAFAPAFIKRWSRKAKRVGIYDYFKHPDGYWDMPGSYTLDELMKRAIFATNEGSEGTTYESSYSKFATAIPLWVLCQYMCTGESDWQKNYNTFINDLYGTAAPAIKGLFDIFYRQTQFESADLNESLNYIQKAQQLSSDQQVLLRINELKLYLCYIYLRLKSQDIETGDIENRMLPLEKIAWTLYQKKIIHSYRIMQLTSYSFMNPKTTDTAVANHFHKLQLMTFPETNDPAVLWKNNYSYSADELDNLFKEMNKPKTKAGPVSNVPVTVSEEVAVAKSDYQPMHSIAFKGTFRSRGYFYLFSEKPETVTINWSLISSNGEAPNATISGADKNYKAVYDYSLESSTGKLSISIPAGESSFFINSGTNINYTLQLQTNSAFCYFEPSPWSKMVFLDEKGTPNYRPPYFPTYIYVPKNIAEVQYKVQANYLKISDPEGKPVSTKLIKQLVGGIQLRSFAVPKNFSGKFWHAITPGVVYYQFLNIPDRYFLFVKK